MKFFFFKKIDWNSQTIQCFNFQIEPNYFENKSHSKKVNLSKSGNTTYHYAILIAFNLIIPWHRCSVRIHMFAAIWICFHTFRIRNSWKRIIHLINCRNKSVFDVVSNKFIYKSIHKAHVLLNIHSTDTHTHLRSHLLSICMYFINICSGFFTLILWVSD